MPTISNDYDYSRYTPVDNTGISYSPFRSAYKNIRFAIPVGSTLVVTEADMANLVGIAFRTYGDVSFWRIILAYNGIQDAVQDVYPGKLLKLPRKADVVAYLTASQTGQSFFVI